MKRFLFLVRSLVLCRPHWACGKMPVAEHRIKDGIFEIRCPECGCVAFGINPKNAIKNWNKFFGRK